MIISKEICILALLLFTPDRKELDKLLDELEDTCPEVDIVYEKDNEKDPEAMVAKYGLRNIGYVNADDKRFIKPILDRTGRCRAKFFETYRGEGHTPVFRVLVVVNLDDVEKSKPGEEWEGWKYSFPVVPQLEELSTTDFINYIDGLMLDVAIPYNHENARKAAQYSPRLNASVTAWADLQNPTEAENNQISVAVRLIELIKQE